MKKKIKGTILFMFIVSILIFWATVSSLPSTMPHKISDTKVVKNVQFCGHDKTKSNEYLKEYKIPNKCIQPLAIIDDPYANIWFAQTTNNSISKFNQFKKLFITYNNNTYESNEKSMIWGMDYSDSYGIWYAGDQDHIWQLNIVDKKYNKIPYSYANSLLQRIKINNSEMMVLNDFTNNKIVIIDPMPFSTETKYLVVASPLENAFTSGFVIDPDKNIWYTNWIFQQYGKLIKLNYSQLKSELKDYEDQENKHMETYDLPDYVITPNGISLDNHNNVWITDTSSSLFIKFKSDYREENFIRYVTSEPPPSTYGNYSKTSESPISRPYWNEFNNGEIIFNEQTSNSIAVFDIKKEELTEYLIPTKNSNWSDCGSINDCGINQVFAFTTHGNGVWFTEWVENNIGNINTEINPTFNIHVSDEINLHKDKDEQIRFTITSKADNNLINIISNNINPNLITDIQKNKIVLDENESVNIGLMVKSTSSYLHEKFLIGGRNNNITISRYITTNVTQ